MTEENAPDFAMLRAVEILAAMHERARKAPNQPPPPLERPVVLFNERIAFAVGTTTRVSVERELGIAFSYPAPGWHTYAVSGPNRERRLLSAFYAKGTLLAAEFYVARTGGAPMLEPRALGSFRFVPGEVELGANVAAIAQHFVPASGGPGPVIFDEAFEARFAGGVAYVMARKGTIERLALYTDTMTLAPS
ncbi:MAG TPA: hypothetical protein VIG51_08745 [Candidatus Baltobacteraceae bacterium]|jgi:hypothetical protein